MRMIKHKQSIDSRSNISKNRIYNLISKDNMRKENKNMTLNPSSSSKGPKLPKHSNLIDARRKSNNSKLAAKKVISSERILDKLSPRVVSSFANQYSQF